MAKYTGGMLGMLRDIQGSRIRSFWDIDPILTFVEAEVLTQELMTIPHHSFSSLKEVLTRFLQGTGIPPGFDSQVYGLDLREVGGGGPDSTAFRSLMFLKAATGTDHVQTGSTVQVGFPAVSCLPTRLF